MSFILLLALETQAIRKHMHQEGELLVKDAEIDEQKWTSPHAGSAAESLLSPGLKKGAPTWAEALASVSLDGGNPCLVSSSAP